MKLSKSFLPVLLIIGSLITSFMPYGGIKSHIILCILTILIIVLFIRYNTPIIYTILLSYILLLGIVLFIKYHVTYANVMIVLIWLHPYFGIKLQAVRYNNVSPRIIEKSHIHGIAFLYVIYFFRMLYFSEFSMITGWMFHSSSLALLGSILALEIFRNYKNTYLTGVAIILLALPVLGALRQYIYILIPILMYIIFSKRLRKNSIITIVVLLFVVIFTPIREQILALQSSTTNKAASIMEYFSITTKPDEEETFETRADRWTDAIQRTIRSNIILGHSLNYRFKPSEFSEYSRSSLLHSYFVSAFADGGLILLGIVFVMFFRNFRKAIRNKDYYSALILYAFVIIFGFNTTALTTDNSYILFYIYAYYDFRLQRNSKSSGDYVVE